MTQPLPVPMFCPYCGSSRPPSSAPCPKCGSPAMRSGMGASDSPAGRGVDPVTFFGEDVETLLYQDPETPGGEGTYWVNPDKLKVKFQWQTGQLNNQFPFVIPANQQVKFRVRINAETGLRGDTEVGAFLLTSSGRLAVQPFVPILEKHLSNVLIPTNLMFGTAQLQALLAETLYALPNFDWTMDAKDLSGQSNTVSPVFFSRRFLDSGKDRVQAARRAAGMSRFMHPFWLGPTTAFNNTLGVAINPNPTVAIPANSSVTVTYSVPSDAYFDCRWLLDDSTDSDDADIADTLVAQIYEGGPGKNLIDCPQGSNGISWRSFLATPTVGVTGFPSGGATTATGGIRAASLPGPAGGWSHLFTPGTDIQVTFVSTNAKTITLRAAFVGVLIYAKTPQGACK